MIALTTPSTTFSTLSAAPLSPVREIREESGVQALAGLYQLDIRIGERLFHDLVVFQKAEVEQLADGQRIELGGTLTVPGVFTVALKGEALETLVDGAMDRVQVSFEITAIELLDSFINLAT